METEIKQLKEGLELAKQNRVAEKTANEDKLRSNIKLNQDLNDFFYSSNFQIHNLENATKEIDDWKAKAQSLIDRKNELTTFKVHKDYSDNYTLIIEGIKQSGQANLDRFIESTSRIFSQSTGEKGGNWENAYYNMQGTQIFWDAAVTLFPEEPQFLVAYKKITAHVNLYGSLDNIYVKTQGNKVERIKNTKLPPATVKDAALEKILIEGFNKKYGQEYKGTALKAVLTQDGWTIERNSITGIVTGRNRTGKIAYKGNDGKCYLLSNNIFIYQAFIGNSFSNTEVIYNGLGGEEMLCENVK